MNEFIIRKTYIKLMTVQIFGIVISAANSTIDVMITGIFLGPNILAATGLFAPAATVIEKRRKTPSFSYGDISR